MVTCVECGTELKRRRGRPRVRCIPCAEAFDYARTTRACLTCGTALVPPHRSSYCEAHRPLPAEPQPTADLLCRVCRRPFRQRISTQVYCSPACRDRNGGFARTSKASSDRRGYGTEHRKARAAFIAQLERDGVGICCIGGEPIYPGQSLHLDHTPDRQSYRGLACAHHNRVDGARRGRARQG